MIIDKLRIRKKIEEVCNKYLFNKGFYESQFPYPEWYVGPTNSAEWDKKGVDVFATNLKNNKSEYIDEKTIFSSSDEIHLKILGNDEGIPCPRTILKEGGLTSLYLFYFIKDRCNGDLSQIQTEADIEELEVFLISRETLKKEVLKAFQEDEEELLKEAILMRSSNMGKSFTRCGISLFHNKRTQDCNENPVFIDIPRDIAEKIALFHGIV